MKKEAKARIITNVADDDMSMIVNENGEYMGRYVGFFFKMQMWTRNAMGEKLPLAFYILVPAYVFLFAISFIEMNHNWGNLALMTETLDMALIYVVTCHKCVNLMVRERDFKRLILVVEGNFYRPQQRDNTQHAAVIQRSVQEGRYLYLLWTALSGVTLIGPTVLPLGEDLLLHGTNTSNYNWRIPYRTWTPFDEITGFPYGLIYVIHLFINSVQVLVVGGYDIIFISFVVYACAQFRILQHTLKNIKQISSQNLKKQQLRDLSNPWLSLLREKGSVKSSSSSGEREMRILIADCVDHHEKLLNFVERLDGIVNAVLLTQFFCSSVIICISAFQLTVGSVSTMKLANMFILLVAALFEMGMFCYFSDVLQDESKKIGQAVYSSMWYHCSQSDKRSMIIIIARTRRPCKITFGKFSDLSLKTYAAIVRISYTYFTVLNGLNDD